MGGTTKRDIELTVRGRNLSQQPMQEVATSINGVTKALTEQLQAAQRGEAGAEELTSTLRQLREAGDALIRQQGLIDRFKALGDSLEIAQKKAADATAANAKLREEFAQLEAPTKRQQQALDRSAVSQEKANNAVTKAQGALDRQAEALREIGIEAANMDAAQQQILTLAGESATAYTALTQTLNGLSRAERERRAAAQAAANDDKVRRQTDEQVAALKREAEAQELASQRTNEAIEQTRRRADTTAVFTALLDKLEKEEKDLANATALQDKLDRELATFRALADQVDITARGYKTLGDAASAAASARTPVTNAGAAVQNAVNPAAVARSTVSGSAGEAEALAATAEAAAKARKPVQDFSDTMASLKAVLKAVADQAGTLDAFSRQAAAVQASKAAYEALANEVTRLEQAVRQSTAPNDVLAQQLAAARSAASAAQRAFESEASTLNSLGAAARKAGIDTENLTADEARLAATARTAQGAMDSLSATHDKYGEALKNSTANSGFFQVGERQSLSLIQRIRGEILSLTAAYVGLQAVLGLAGGAIDAYVDKQAAENRLAVAVGNDQKAIAQEYDYVHAQAERLGIGVKELADEYSRFSIAGKNGNLSLEQRRYAFERITEVMRVNHSSTEDIGRAWVQLEQILSKGKVQMDDLRAAANSLPGIETALAKGLQNLDPTKFAGLSDGIDKIIKSKDKAQAIPILFKAMKDGSVDAKVAILALAQEYEKEYGDRLPQALKSLQAEQGRFSTQLYDFKLLIAQSGFADAYTALLQKLSTFFKSDDGKKFAEDIGAGFAGLTKVLTYLIDNLETVEAVLKLIVEIKALTWTAELIGGFGTLATKVADLSEKLAASNISWASFTNSATAGQKALLLVQGALGVVSAAVVGWQIGTIIQEKFAIVRVAVNNFFAYLDSFGAAFWSGVQILLINFVGAITDTFSEALIKFKTFANEIGNAQASLYRAIGATGTADKLTDIFGDPKQLQSDLDKRKALREKEIQDIRDKSNAAIKLALDQRTTLADEEKLAANAAKAKSTDSGSGTTANPSEIGTLNKTEDDKKEKAAEARAKKIETLEGQLAEQLRSIDAKTEKAQKDSLDARLKAVDDTYQKIYENLDKLQKLGGTKVTVKNAAGDDVTYSIAQYKAQVESMKDIVKQQETEKFNKETLKTQETDLNNLLEERKSRLKEINELFTSGAITAAEAFERSTKVFDDLNPKIKTAADNAKAFANASVGKGVTSSQAGAFSAKADGASDTDAAERAQALDVLKAGEAQINALIAQRKDIINANNDLVNVGLETEKDAQENIQAQNAIIGPQITDQVTRLQAVLAQMHEDGALTDQDLALWAPKLKAAGAQAEILSASLVRAKELVSTELVQGADALLTSVSTGIAGAIKGTNSWNDALKGVADTALNFLADFLVAIAKAIIKQQVLNAIQAASKDSSGGSGGIYGTALSALASVLHEGGTVGGGNGMSRSAPAALWNNAPRYHTGTVVGGGAGGGLKSDERRAILQVGEEVLTKNDPRNVLNGGKTASNGNASEIGQPGGDTHMHVHADAASFLSAGLNQRAGQKSFFAFLSANRAYISKMLQSG